MWLLRCHCFNKLINNSREQLLNHQHRDIMMPVILFTSSSFSFQYFVLVVLIFVMEIVAGILAFVYRIEIEKVVTKELYKGINTKYPADSAEDVDGLRTGWHAIQAHVSTFLWYFSLTDVAALLRICFSYSSSVVEWTITLIGMALMAGQTQITFLFPAAKYVLKTAAKMATQQHGTQRSVVIWFFSFSAPLVFFPYYVSKNWDNQICCTFSANLMHIHEFVPQGCLEELKFWFQQNLYIVGVVGITVGVIQVSTWLDHTIQRSRLLGVFDLLNRVPLSSGARDGGGDVLILLPQKREVLWMTAGGRVLTQHFERPRTG